MQMKHDLITAREMSKGRSAHPLELRLRANRPDDGEVSWAGEELRASWIYRTVLCAVDPKPCSVWE